MGHPRSRPIAVWKKLCHPPSRLPSVLYTSPEGMIPKKRYAAHAPRESSTTKIGNQYTNGTRHLIKTTHARP